MSTRSARRRSTRNRDAQTLSDDDQSHTNGDVTMNGNGSAHAEEVIPAADDDEVRENIFLFWPNIIGKLSYTTNLPLPNTAP